MCSVLQRRTLFPHLRFQTWSEPGVLCAFWLGNVLRAPMACTLVTCQLPKVVREWCALYILTWNRASRQWRVIFFDVATSKSVRSWGALYILTSNVLHGTTVCTFSTSQRLKVLRSWSVLYILTCFVAQRHANIHLSFGQMAPHPPLWRGYYLTIWSHIGRTQWSATFLPFRAPASSFFSLFLLSDLLSSSLLLPDSSHLCIHNCPYCRKFHF